MALIDRLRLSKDLALEGADGLVPQASDAASIRGIVLLDLAFDVAARAALDHLGIVQPHDFPQMVAAVPGLVASAPALLAFHTLRNAAQHRGNAPPAAARQQLCLDVQSGLEAVFALAGHDFVRFSSVPQITSEYFREPLQEALDLVDTAPEDAVALGMQVFVRLRGWAEQVVGRAAIPKLMWVNVHPRWLDVFGMVKCADNRDEFVDGMLKLAATTVLKIGVPAWVRLENLADGHRCERKGDDWRIVHDEDAEPVSEADARWAVETVARATLALEIDWPDFVLVKRDASAPEPPVDPRQAYLPMTVHGR